MASALHPFFSLDQQGLVRIAAVAPPVHIADPVANLAEHWRLIDTAEAEGAALVLFPELSLTGYAIDDLHLQAVVIAAAEQALASLVADSVRYEAVLVVGVPVRAMGGLFNTAAVVHRGRLLGVVPKTFLPNYREFYEKRWFRSGNGVVGQTVTLAGQTVPFGTDLVFADTAIPDFSFGIEICEDLWAPRPPSTLLALNGAHVLLNLSASNVLIGKAETRRRLCATQSQRALAAYVFTASGPGESTTDLTWDGQAMIWELGEPLAEGARFAADGAMVMADVDVQRIALERLRTPTFQDAVQFAGGVTARRIGFERTLRYADLGLMRPKDRFPFVPDDPARRDQDCFEGFNIQVHGLMQRLKATGVKTAVIGISGGLDSTQALIVTVKAFDRLGLPRTGIRAYTLPGFATSEGSKADAWALMRALGVTAEEIDIRPAAERMLADLGHPYSRGEPVYDLTFENVQAGLRTDYLFRLAGHFGGFVVGTGDLSELALGWATYGVGDHMSHYNVNCGAPKTLIQHLIAWAAEAEFDAETAAILRAILSREISPELVPAGADGKGQITEATVGPYALQDFTLYYLSRFGLPPSKIVFLAWHAWKDAEAGRWPDGYPADKRVAYDLAAIRHWMRVFLKRFFVTSQYKRSAVPNGPKLVSGGALSPRGDWRAPSDGNANAWLAELEYNLPSES